MNGGDPGMGRRQGGGEMGFCASDTDRAAVRLVDTGEDLDEGRFAPRHFHRSAP